MSKNRKDLVHFTIINEENDQLIEDTWEISDTYNSDDGGIGFIRRLMDGIRPPEVRFTDLGWALEKICGLLKAIIEKQISKEFLGSSSQSLVSDYLTELLKKMEEYGIKVKIELSEEIISRSKHTIESSWADTIPDDAPIN
jgi:hypothetical protein